MEAKKRGRLIIPGSILSATSALVHWQVTCLPTAQESLWFTGKKACCLNRPVVNEGVGGVLSRPLAKSKYDVVEGLPALPQRPLGVNT